MKTTSPLITDNQSLIGAATRFGHTIPVYDDGYGPLWIHRNSMGISGIVRAQTFETAYGICEDEFFPEATETLEEIRADYNKRRQHVKMIRTCAGEREAEYPGDYPNGKLSDSVDFVGWKTIETPAAEGEEVWSENELFCEAFGFRPNGPNDRDILKHGIYAKDLIGDSLEMLTPELVAALEITLSIEENE